MGVREAFALRPELWEIYDLSRSVERTIIGTAAGENALRREALERKMDSLRAELEGPTPTPLEKLLVERVALCWLQANYEDIIDAQNRTGRTWTASLSQQKRAETAQRRFLAAVKTLATVRRLALPALQVNIAAHGGKQVNVANLAAPSDEAPDE
ncbi:MAG TPA: hypothetical protein VK689_13635 [Armatimonadota bacterium]|nr:hypothetical protein [Armatimonadota bacterium]